MSRDVSESEVKHRVSVCGVVVDNSEWMWWAKRRKGPGPIDAITCSRFFSCAVLLPPLLRCHEAETITPCDTGFLQINRTFGSPLSSTFDKAVSDHYSGAEKCCPTFDVKPHVPCCLDLILLPYLYAFNLSRYPVCVLESLSGLTLVVLWWRDHRKLLGCWNNLAYIILSFVSV
jgi:hypothetical protein